MPPEDRETPPLPPAPGLYVHVPFCASKCHYCGFFSITSPLLRDDFVTAAVAEAVRHRDAFDAFDTVYLGGGTPTVLSDAQLSRLVDGLRDALRIARGAEITIEANPGDVTVDRLRTLQGIGFNRLSLGVQSFRDKELRFLGRRHTADQALAAFQAARDAGFDNVGIDLIWGVSTASEDHWRRVLDQAVALRPEHLSCYQLTIEGGTRLGHLQESGRLPNPAEDALVAQFLAMSEVLAAAGYEHYEVSNFALPGRRSRHNGKYWNHTPYLGLGPAAHSFNAHRRWWNVRSVDAYCLAVREGRAPTDGSEDLTDDQLRLETLALGLRTSDGVAMSVLAGTPGLDRKLATLIEAGWVRVENGRLLPTTRGLLVADRLPLLL